MVVEYTDTGAALYPSRCRVVLPTKLRIYPRNDDNTAASEPLIVAVDLSKYAFE
ncbi:MAG: hypothetical protein QOF92_926 [Pseudonocardiales bacterium]|jgi:hypothetical protein|nr:hypothetical protein [Pseudonocardiales bacterium]